MLEQIVDKVPDGLEAAYVEKDGKFHLDIDSSQLSSEKTSALETQLQAAKSQISEFRTNNRRLFDENNELKNADGDISPDVLTELDELRSDNAAKDTKLSSVTSQLEKVVLTDEVSKAALKYGVQESALVDVTSRAKTAFNVVDGKAVHVSGKKTEGGGLVSVDDWMKDLSDSASHLFSQSQGSGTQRTVNGKQTTSMSSTQKIMSGLAKK